MTHSKSPSWKHKDSTASRRIMEFWHSFPAAPEATGRSTEGFSQAVSLTISGSCVWQRPQKQHEGMREVAGSGLEFQAKNQRN